MMGGALRSIYYNRLNNLCIYHITVNYQEENPLENIQIFLLIY